MDNRLPPWKDTAVSLPEYNEESCEHNDEGARVVEISASEMLSLDLGAEDDAPNLLIERRNGKWVVMIARNREGDCTCIATIDDDKSKPVVVESTFSDPEYGPTTEYGHPE
jgi:hypothetical protein